MKKTHLISLLLICISKITQAQNTFQKTYGGTGEDFAQSVQQTNDGGYIIAGETKSFGAGNDDIYLIKTDANGNTLWTKTYGGQMKIGNAPFNKLLMGVILLLDIPEQLLIYI